MFNLFAMHPPRPGNAFDHEYENTMSSTHSEEDIKNEERAIIFQTLLENSTDETISYGSVTPIAAPYEVHKSAMWDTWKWGKETMHTETDLADVSKCKTRRCEALKRSFYGIQFAGSEVPASNDLL